MEIVQDAVFLVTSVLFRTACWVHMFISLGMYIAYLESKWRLSPAAERKLVIKGKQILCIKQKFLLAYPETKSFLFRLLRELLYKDSIFAVQKLILGLLWVGWLVNSSVEHSWGSLALVLLYFVTFQWGSDGRQCKDCTSVFWKSTYSDYICSNSLFIGMFFTLH